MVVDFCCGACGVGAAGGAPDAVSATVGMERCLMVSRRAGVR